MRWLPLLLGLLALVPWTYPAEARPSPEGIPSGFGTPGDYVNPIDGSVFVTVPAGEYFVGALPNDEQAWRDEQPGRTVHLPSFQISLYEVTNAQYARFLKDGYHPTNPNWRKYAASWGPAAPVVAVSQADAVAYCRWAKARLPSEEEWERAARGLEPRIFPWGNDWNPDRVVWNTDRPGPVNSLPAGRSPAGCYHMAGNVWEWTDTRFTNGSYVLRGGCWGTNFNRNLRCSDRNQDQPGNHGNRYIGFRCARTPGPASDQR